MPSYTERYDKPAQAYEERLKSTSIGEEDLAKDLWDRTRADTEAQHAQQTTQAYGDIAGAASQGAPGQLRSASYAQGQMGQQYSNDASMLASLEDQAYREQMMQVLGRRGDYGMQSMGFAADQYGRAQQQQSYDRAMEEQKKLQEAQEVAETVGMISSMMGAGLAGG
jgi:hypothetical protein